MASPGNGKGLVIRQAQLKQMAAAQPGTPVIRPCKTAWIEFHLVDRNNKPVPGEPYEVRLPDYSIMTGALDREGKVRFDGICPGQASICFPGLDRHEWWPL